MKQFLISLLIVMGIFLLVEDEIVIPDSAIRLRVIANSNSDYDQSIKKKVREEVQDEMYNLLKDTTNIDIARNTISNNLNILNNRVDNVLKTNNYNNSYNINFGYNYFPSKEYKGLTYKEGMYESLVVTLGSGKGDNWWCVLFPPFCLIEAEENESSEVEYKWKIKEIIDKYF